MITFLATLQMRMAGSAGEAEASSRPYGTVSVANPVFFGPDPDPYAHINQFKKLYLMFKVIFKMNGFNKMVKNRFFGKEK
jgi:hypothetical protein